jgi:hypothetical protein
LYRVGRRFLKMRLVDTARAERLPAMRHFMAAEIIEEKHSRCGF